MTALAKATSAFDRMGMDSSIRSIKSENSNEIESDKFLTMHTSPVKAAERRASEVPKATLRVIGKNSVNVNMAMAELLNSHGCVPRRRPPRARASRVAEEANRSAEKNVRRRFLKIGRKRRCVVEHSEQFRDHEVDCYFQRVEFCYGTMRKPAAALEDALDEVCGRLGLEFNLSWGTRPKRICIFVSKYDHVLWEILLRHKAGELPCDIPLIISNHEDLRPIADAFGIRFEVFKITKDTKRAVEDLEFELMRELEVDLVVLARYMQIISDEFCAQFRFRVINIHHSFLPAFIGAKPYHRAFDRGVKLIGATAHYATANLDEGPIIEQEVESVSHRDSIDDLLRKGRGVERRTLLAALRAHLDDRVIVYGNKTVVFDD